MTLVSTALEPRQRPALGDRPLFDALEVTLHVGGQRYPIDPMGPRVFPSGPGLALDDLRLAIERLHAVRVAGARPLAERLGLWPGPDPFEHTAPASVWLDARNAELGCANFHEQDESRLIPSDGWRLGTDPGGVRLLEELAAAGLRHIWFTLLGQDATHDALCQRPGAFAAVMAGLERCMAVGIGTGANIVVSTRNTVEIAALASRVRQLGVQEFVPTYVAGWVSADSGYEAIRPMAEDLVGLSPAGLDVAVNWGYREFWSDVAAYTEGGLLADMIAGHGPKTGADPDASAESGASVQSATSSAAGSASEAAIAEVGDAAGTHPTDGEGAAHECSAGDTAARKAERGGVAGQGVKRELPLLVDRNLDLWVGSVLAPPLRRVANLRSNTAAMVYRALADLSWPPAPPPDAELALRFGDRTSRLIHPGTFSVRRKCLATWRAKQRPPWATDC